MPKITTCGYCGSTTGVREIIWGMPDGEPDPSKLLVGGCCISDDDPSHRCIECGWELRSKN